jgi:hypothetical protein
LALFSSLFGGGGGGRTLRWKVAVPAVSFKEPRKNKNKKMEEEREREKKGSVTTSVHIDQPQ